MMRTLFLGDIHKNFNLISQYVKLYDIRDASIIQVGDLGVGYNLFTTEKKWLEDVNNVLVDRDVTLYAIRGNHDYKPYFDNDPFELSNIKLIPDYTILNIGDNNILCIGGAVSVDRKLLKSGISWWEDEVFILDKEKIDNIRGVNIIVTHTAPEYCPPDNRFGFGPFVDEMIKDTGDDKLKSDLMIERKTVTDAFEFIKTNNSIEYHLYGHFHRSQTLNLNGIQHRMLGIGELYELITDDYYPLNVIP